MNKITALGTIKKADLSSLGILFSTMLIMATTLLFTDLF